ncbi:MAG: acylneuraminate cytidylyltransferase family protein, partial [bacterium]|nr:acylneuraminate cytidylyltransferase family protein [bacterium]
PVNHNPAQLLRTQDLDPLYEENSNFYIFSRKSFFENNKNRIGKKPFLYEMKKTESVDIDRKEDFVMAEMLYRLRQPEGNS